LFPLDILFLFALGIALATGSVFFARHAVLVSEVWPVIWWIIPVVYLISDFAEHVLLIGILKNPLRLTARSFSSLALATNIKIKSVTAGFCQLAALGLLAGLKMVL
jgi:ABC-type polysaccharide/polyol phosphate export permease